MRCYFTPTTLTAPITLTTLTTLATLTALICRTIQFSIRNSKFYSFISVLVYSSFLMVIQNYNWIFQAVPLKSIASLICTDVLNYQYYKQVDPKILIVQYHTKVSYQSCHLSCMTRIAQRATRSLLCATRIAQHKNQSSGNYWHK